MDKDLPSLSVMPTKLWLVQISTVPKRMVRILKAAFLKVCSGAVVSTLLTPGTHFVEDNFPQNGGAEDGFGMIQVHYIYCELYFCYYDISSTSDHEELDPGGQILLI